MFFKFIKQVVVDVFKTIGGFIAIFLFSVLGAGLFFAFCCGVGRILHLLPFLDKWFDEKNLAPSYTWVGLCTVTAVVLTWFLIDYLIKTWKEMSLQK